LNRQEFVVVGWSDPEGSRPHLGALLLGYYPDDGKLIYAGRVGTGMPVKVLADLRRRLEPLARKTSTLNVLPPRKTRFGSPLVLSRVHWVEPKLVVEITYLTWTADNLLRRRSTLGRGMTNRPIRFGASEQNLRLAVTLPNVRANGVGAVIATCEACGIGRT
jgi:ATP-dependent DNA ligase